MGNEESQQGGAPGQQQGAPGGFGMGPPQQQTRFGVPQIGAPPGMRQVAPTGRPNLRPGGPGPPQPTMRGAFPGGAGPGPRPPQQQQQGGPVRPVQVGVQPWAEPPVQQPPHFRGPAPQPLRPQLQQQQQQQQLKAKQQQQMMEAEMDAGLDLSNLSEEEKARILSVMARAQDMDQDYERHKRAKEEPSEVRPPLLCPICQAVDLALETNKMCGDCGKNFCQKCGTFVPGEGRRSVWVCNTCSNRRKQISAAAAASKQQDTTTYTMAGGQKVAGDPGGGSSSRKDETMSRMGQPFQTPQQTQQQQQGVMVPTGSQQQTMVQQQQQPSVSLLGGGTGAGSSGGTGLMSGSLIPSSAVGGRGAGTIPGTVPLAAVPQQQPWNGAPTNQQTWNMQQTPLQQQPFMQQGVQQQQLAMSQPQTQGMMTTQQQQQKQLGRKGESCGSGWSPVTDLSPILDVSPSLGAAEQELMEKCALQGQREGQLRPGGIPRAQSGTVSSLLADFNKSVGQTTPTIDDGMQQNRMPLAQQPQLQPQQQTQLGQQKTVLTGGTEMDQNQNLVQQHQFQLQQQQLMIQQQQQVIQQQQQQLQQQQMHQQQIQGHQQVMTQDNIQQQQPMTANTLVQQQPGVVVIGGTPMQQPTQSSQRKVHRRLPQPTVDQMQAAVALAAQTPRSKPQVSTRTTSIGVTSSFQRPVSPIMQSTTNTTSLYESTFLGVPQSAAATTLSTSLYTSANSPSQRKDQDCISLIESESGKKVRRRLPPVPLDQEPTTVPLRRTKDRSRTLSMPLSTSADRGAWMENSRRMPQRTTSLDDGMSLTKAMAGSSILDTLGITSSSTTSADTYLRLLGLIGTTTATTTTTTTTSILDSIPSSVGLSASLLGRRDLSAPHSLSLYRDTVIPTSTTSAYLLDSDPGSKLPSYIMSLKQQLRDELRSTVTDMNRRRITDPDLSGLLSHSSWASDTGYDRKLGPTSSTTLPLAGSRMAAGTAAARRNRHRRHASDTKLSSFKSFGRDELLDDPLSRYKLYQGTSTMPFKSYEFESIDDHLGPSYGAPYRGVRTYPRRSSLTDLMPDELRDTAVGSSSLISKDPAALRRYNRLRRHTDTGLASLSLAGLDPYGRHHHFRGGPRSWHPSPYVSEDEDTEREEKKAKIKAEIARRRQHIEERLMHGEQYPYKTRSQLSGYSIGGPLWADRLYDSPLDGGPGLEMDPMTRRDTYTRSHGYMSSTYPAYRNGNSVRYSERGWPYDPYAYADDLADPYDLDAYSPTLDSELAPMPLLPDMPTRSRRLLHDLGSAPLGPTTRHNRSGAQLQQQHYDEYEGRSRRSTEDPRHHRQQPHTNSHPRHSSPSAPGRKAQQNPSGGPKYEFPVKRILLTRDPKDRSVSGNGLGMKVVGGKEIPGSNGEIGAYVARIYPGGVVETLGEVREGDQVLEWNGVSLTGKTYEEVQRIIATSGDEVEIVIRSDFNMLPPRSSSHQHHNRHHQHEQQNHPESRLSRSGGQHNQSSTGRSTGGSSYHNQQQQQQTGYRTSRGYSNGRNYDGSPTNEAGMHNYNNCVDIERCGSASPPRGYRATSPSRHHQRIGSPTGKADTTDNKEKYRAENITGEIQLQVCYDSKASILYVTIVRARNLVTSRDNSGLPDPYVKCYLLPDRRVENQRRTRYFSRCSDPEWKQTMVYPQVPQDQLRKRHLEISVWNYDVARPPEFLGEVILDLKDPSVIDEQSRWYKLHPHDPKKYPSQSNSEGGIKMARLNNPVGNKSALYLENDDIRKQQHTA